jgi:hypothetical protein
MARVKRRSLIAAPFIILLLLGTGSSWAANGEDPIGERFNEEVLKYDIGFWIFNRVGEGQTIFRSLGHGRYSAHHEAKTLGLVGWVSRHRRDVYRSSMGSINNGKRLIPLRFEEDVVIGKMIRKRITVYDYSARKVVIETQKEEKHSREEIEIPFGVVYDDPMTAFYNFRAGVYGKVEPGKEFLIYTVPREGSQKAIRLVVASKEEREKRLSAEVEKEKKAFFITVHMDKELVGSLQGLAETWFSADVTPISGVAKDVLFWGDIIGKLTYQGFTESPGKPNPSSPKGSSPVIEK